MGRVHDKDSCKGSFRGRTLKGSVSGQGPLDRTLTLDEIRRIFTENKRINNIKTPIFVWSLIHIY